LVQTVDDQHAATVLLVDDEPNIVELVWAALWLDGFTLHAPTNGARALAAVAHTVPDIVVLDVLLPDLTAQQPTHLLIRDGRVGQHRQDLLGQHRQDLLGQREFVLAALGPLRELVGQLVPGPGLPTRDGLVEQRHHLIEHVDRGLRHQRNMIGYRRCGSRRLNFATEHRRPTAAKNRRRSAGSLDRSNR
jgi:hypothetical protein